MDRATASGAAAEEFTWMLTGAETEWLGAMEEAPEGRKASLAKERRSEKEDRSSAMDPGIRERGLFAERNPESVFS